MNLRVRVDWGDVGWYIVSALTVIVVVAVVFLGMHNLGLDP
jgi:hypothetical protein